ncbi:hypothetical protein OESDEN_12085 [Oesophagostomum dentatum]|uniref:SCP domain-containing protein n=1 Tax=Oesophagostomum dentatum TaxID=61180 RepID=A0A0B1ST78_OESDE|nr:hypothetical protein OESDEN_12085 [Oesophagostomum dentatum]
MPFQKWSCLLENEMQKQLSKCPAKFPQINDFGHNMMTIYDHKGVYALPHSEVRNALRDWWSELDIYGISDPVVKFTSEDLHNFANMVFADNTEIGCSYASCEKDRRVLIGCLYRRNGAVKNQVLYSSGRACKYNVDCETYKNSKCLRDGLCNKGRFHEWT